MFAGNVLQSQTAAARPAVPRENSPPPTLDEKLRTDTLPVVHGRSVRKALPTKPKTAKHSIMKSTPSPAKDCDSSNSQEVATDTITAAALHEKSASALTEDGKSRTARSAVAVGRSVMKALPTKEKTAKKDVTKRVRIAETSCKESNSEEVSVTVQPAEDSNETEAFSDSEFSIGSDDLKHKQILDENCHKLLAICWICFSL